MPRPIDPAVQTRSRRVVAVVAAVFTLLMLTAGGRQLLLTETGPRTRATVNACTFDRSGKTSWTTCTGTWTLARKTTSGTIVNADIEDIGTTIEVTVHDDTAYAPRFFSSLFLIVGGVLIGGATTLLIRASRHTARMR